MSRSVHLRLNARQDLADIFRHYAREAGFRVARRFFAHATLTRLANMPGTGTLRKHDHPSLAGLRHFPISRFRNYIVFYRPVADGIEVVRVLHGAHDVPGILAESESVEDDDGNDAPGNT